MNYLLKSISYIFHPLFTPIMCVCLYFSKSPRYITQNILIAKILSLLILTVILPILVYILLKKMDIVKTIHLETPKERVLPLLINSAIILLIIRRIFTVTEYIELYYFFIGILISTITCLILAIAKFKASIHMIAMCSAFMYFLALSIHFNTNFNSVLAIIAIITGAVATSRLHLKAHTNIELLVGGIVGFIPQLILIKYWL